MMYFDNAATTCPSRSALDKAQQFNNEKFFNPSTLYSGGLNCAREIKSAKETILKCLGTSNHEVIFTSCGSESDNMAIFCARQRGVFVTDKGEHSAVYQSFLELKNRGLQIEFIDLNPDGTVDEEKLYNYVKNSRVDFVSIAHVGNETGAINDINKIAKKIKSINKDIIFHSDGVQAFGKIPYRLSQDIDLYSISAHKINALKGVGALIKRKNLSIKPLIFGGGQENGLRSGTENVFGIKVFEFAAIEKYDNLQNNYEYVKSIKAYFEENLDRALFKIISAPNSSPYILTISAVGLRGEVVMHSMEEFGLIVGNGSACSSKNRFSRVIEACGYKNDVLDGVIRISFSTFNSINEAKNAVEILNNTVKKLKGILG
ncbi:MAG: aminotransferase class V-fold PLP-dependent enzyme [Clostridiales bacterium]|nr:aminotransferase class V-fold PLP-dependent enzyme [Clostridiales bacterium]